MATAIAVAVPLWTLVPRKQRFRRSSGEWPSGETTWSVFSTGMDSPVRLAWLIKRSLAETIRASAGIMSPAQSEIRSPRTTSRSGISLGVPSRMTVLVTRTIARSLAAAAPALVSWANRSPTPKKIMRTITTAARESPVSAEVSASTASNTTSGLRNVCASRIGQPGSLCVAISFGPSASNRRAASSLVRPLVLVSSCRTTSGCRAAAQSTRMLRGRVASDMGDQDNTGARISRSGTRGVMIFCYADVAPA